MSAPRSGRRALLFVLAGLAVFVVVVFELGRTQSVFSRKVTLRASFQDISGLAVGAPVRLAGFDVGVVQRIAFDPELGVKKVRIVLGVEARYLPRIRGDSIARLASKGLLGDTIVNISIGSADAPPLVAGGELATAEAAGPAAVIDEVRDAVAALRTLTEHVDDRVQAVFTDAFAHDLRRIAHAAAAITEEIEHGRGPAHTLVYDPGADADVRRILGRGGELVLELRGAVVDLGALAHTLRGLGDDLSKGQGTVGALLRDPSVYEELKLILGGVERNRLLKMLVRHAIKHE